MAPGRRRAAPMAAVLAVLLTATGCAASPADPDEIRVVLYQHRADVAAGQLEIQVENLAAHPIVVTRAIVDSPEFAEPMVWTGEGSTVAPGRKLDLPVSLVEVRCAASTTTREVRLELGATEGREASVVTVEASDPFDQVTRIHEEGCFARSIADIAELRIVSVDVASADRPATLEVRADPGTASESYSIDAVGATTLFAPADDAGQGLAERVLGVRFDRAGGTFTITLVPARCDEHAVLEDKQGTLFPLRITRSDGHSGRVIVTAPDHVRTDLYGYVARVCGFDTD